MKFKIGGKVKTKRKQSMVDLGEIGKVVDLEEIYNEVYVQFKKRSIWFHENDVLAAGSNFRGHKLTRMFAPDKPSAPVDVLPEKKPAVKRAKKILNKKPETLEKKLDIPKTCDKMIQEAEILFCENDLKEIDNYLITLNQA